MDDIGDKARTPLLYFLLLLLLLVLPVGMKYSHNHYCDITWSHHLTTVESISIKALHYVAVAVLFQFHHITSTLLVRSSTSQAHYWLDPQHHQNTTGQTLNITSTLLVRPSTSQAHYWLYPQHHKHTTGQILNITRTLLVRLSTSQAHYWLDSQHHKNNTVS